ncbi:MAG: urea transporter [Flavobacteriia bacterium]|nr:urea transporter [Flavobacteriia bacterium]
MGNNLTLQMKYWLESILHSYSQIFFSLNKVLAIIIIFATFFSPQVGLTGLLAVVLINIIAHLVGVNRKLINEGLYGFNAMLLGLFLGHQYQLTGSFWLLFIVAIGFLLITSVWLNSVFGKHGLPFLSFPFIITYWVVVLAVGNFTKIYFNEEHIYTINHIASQKGNLFYEFAHQYDTLQIPSAILIYFKTIAMTFFQSSVLAGILISAGLLYFSRIAFSLSILGFSCAYFFYASFGADVNELDLNFVGSNFIFMAIGIGCFYIVPNIYSYITVFLLTPLLMFLLIFFTKVLAVFQLTSLTLSFSVIVVLFLLFLQHRWFHRFLQLVTIQYYSAEKTIYKYIISVKRFSTSHLAKIQLPFWGEWQVSQGYDGKITHLGDWGKALDFVIIDDTNKTYADAGTDKKDFYCFDKPVVAPMDGFIYDILNTIDDNEINGVNTDQNWGNTIVMNHVNGLFTQISHLKKDSFKVSIGDYVTKGTILATCGNSGRSPEPHIHFQVQLNPKIGSTTISYPIGYFIEKNKEKQLLKIAEIPLENTLISNVNRHVLLTEGFNFYPGKKIQFITENDEVIEWEVFTDQFNKTYIYCEKTKSTAYFVNDGTMLYFYDFEGDKKALLFYFYLASYRILLGCYNDLPVTDSVPLIHFNSILFQWIQDFIAPFYRFTKASYESKCALIDNVNEPTHAILHSKVQAKFLNMTFKNMDFDIELRDKRIIRIGITQKGIKKNYVCG